MPVNTELKDYKKEYWDRNCNENERHICGFCVHWEPKENKRYFNQQGVCHRGHGEGLKTGFDCLLGTNCDDFASREVTDADTD